MDYIGATPQANPLLGLLAERLKQAQEFAAKPFGYSNPPAEIIMNLLGVPAVQQTAERLAYGEPLTTGRGMTTQIRPEAVEAALTVAPVAGLLGKGAETAAMAAGRAGERYAEKVVPQIMERGGLPAQLLGDLSQGSIRPMDVWHGSPYRFEKFDPSKARTGEGNASYGEGAYLAQARGTAEQYRDVLKQKQFAKIVEKGRNDFDVIAPDGTVLAEGVYRGAAQKAYDAFNKEAGNLYKVDLPDESIAKMLDYDKPLSKQAPEVQAALAELGISVDKKKIGEYEDALLDALTNPESTGKLPKQPLDLTGEQILKELERNPSRYFPSAMEGKELTGAMINPKSGVSELLSKKGITGVRYLDQMSRDAGEGTSNFVVFPKYQDLLTIKEINDKPVGGLLGQSKAAESSPITSLKDIENKFNDVTLDVYEKNGTINLSRIVVPKDMRSSGIGSNVMNDLTSYADQTGQKMALTPSGEFGGNVKRLKDFYKQFGFVENKGKNKDFSTMETMIRLPETRKEPKELTNLLD